MIGLGEGCMNIKLYLFLLLLGALSACSAVGVISTDDPAVKLRNADSLLEQGRAIPAERLINEALVTYQAEGNDVGMADAYRAYGLFFSSAAIDKAALSYRKHGFRDEEATLENRHLMAIKYYAKAADIYRRTGSYDRLTNVHYLLGLEHLRIGQRDEGCGDLLLSVEANAENLKANPGARLTLPKGYSDYASYIDALRGRFGCEA